MFTSIWLVGYIAILSYFLLVFFRWESEVKKRMQQTTKKNKTVFTDLFL